MIFHRALSVAFIAAILMAPTGRAQELAARPGSTADLAGEESTDAGAAFIRHFFSALDAGDAAAIQALTEPGAKIVDEEAMEHDVASLLSAPSPAVRRIGNFEVVHAAPVSIVVFDNAVAFAVPDADPIRKTYRETWVLKQTPTGLHVLRATRTLLNNTRPEFSFPALNIPVATGLSPQDQPAADFIERFFYTYPHFQAMETKALFLPGAKIVHYNGEEQSVEALTTSMVARGVSQFKYPWPARSQMFGRYEVVHAGPVMVVTFDNHVLQWRFGNPGRENAFRETWILKQTPEGLKAVWAAYSAYFAVPKAF
jgi:hypothetical protein